MDGKPVHFKFSFVKDNLVSIKEISGLEANRTSFVVQYGIHIKATLLGVLAIIGKTKTFTIEANQRALSVPRTPRITSVQYCGGYSVLRGDSISTAGGNISTAEAVQYYGGIALVLRGDSISTAGDSISTVKG